MSLRQHTIPDPPPIRDGDTTLSIGTGPHDLVDGRIVTAYEIPDSDRRETLLLLDNAKVLLLSCDPGYAPDDATRTPDRWECCMYDATETPAGTAIKTLEPGHWM